MKAGLITMIFLVLAGALSGCGQKGPLYQEEPGQESAEKSVDRDAEADSDANRQNTDNR